MTASNNQAAMLDLLYICKWDYLAKPGKKEQPLCADLKWPSYRSFAQIFRWLAR